MSDEWTIEGESDGQYIHGEYGGANVYISVEVSAIGTPPTLREHVAIEQAPLHLVRAAPLMLKALEAEQAFVDHEKRVGDLPCRDELPEFERAAAWREHDLRHVQLEQRAIALRTAALAAARGESPTRNEET
jgi:hypothetical protein